MAAVLVPGRVRGPDVRKPHAVNAALIAEALPGAVLPVPPVDRMRVPALDRVVEQRAEEVVSRGVEAVQDRVLRRGGERSEVTAGALVEVGEARPIEFSQPPDLAAPPDPLEPPGALEPREAPAHRPARVGAGPAPPKPQDVPG